MRYYGNVTMTTIWGLCVARFLHLQQYSRRLNLLFLFFSPNILVCWRPKFSNFFNSFHHRVEFRTILEGLRNFWGFEPPKSPPRGKPLPINPCFVSSLTRISVWSSEDNDDFDGENDGDINFWLTMAFIMIYTFIKWVKNNSFLPIHSKRVFCLE